MKRILIGLIAAAMLLACEPQLTPITPEFDRSGIKYGVRVITYDSFYELNKAYDAHIRQTGETPIRDPKEGWSGWNMMEPYYCEVHVLKLRGLNDPQMETWGHELAHCIYGTYHKDNER